MSGMMSFLAGLGGGYLQGASQKRRNDQEDEDRKFQQTQRDRTLREQAQQDQTNAQLRMAGSTVQSDPNMVPDPSTDNRDVGQPGTAPAVQDGFRVGGKVLPDQASADAAVAATNAPEARATRMSDVLNAAGRPLDALALSSATMQNKVGGFQLSAAQRADINAKHDALVDSGVKSWDDAANFVTNTKGDGQGGGLAVKAVVSPDGKRVNFNKVGPDGTLTPTAQEFDNTPAGLQTAKMLLKTGISDTDKLTHLHAIAQEQLAAATLAQTAKRDQNTADYQGGMLDYYNDKNTVKSGSVVDKMPEFERLQYTGKLKELQGIDAAMTKAQAEGNWNPKDAATQALIARSDDLRTQTTALEKQYGGGKAGARANPLNLDDAGNSVGNGSGPAKPASGSTRDAARISPAEQAARDKDRGPILQTELAKAQARLATDPERAAEDVRTLQAEIARLPRAARGGQATMGTVASKGTPQAAPTAVAPASSMQATVAASQPAALIPEPPPAVRQVGLTTVANPLYAQWEAQYGDAYRAQQASQLAASQSAADSARTFNPYMQNRVR